MYRFAVTIEKMEKEPTVFLLGAVDPIEYAVDKETDFFASSSTVFDVATNHRSQIKTDDVLEFHMMKSASDQHEDT